MGLRGIAAVLVAAVALGLSGCSALQRSEVVISPAPAAEVELVEVPDVVTFPGDLAQDLLFGLGLKIDWSESVWAPGNWTVDGVEPTPGTMVESGSTVLLTVSKPSREPTPEEATSSGLTGTYAQAACDRRIESEFPYGARAHWIVGKLGESITDDRWWFKVETTVENEYGNKLELNVECYVSGTNDAPYVDELLYY